MAIEIADEPGSQSRSLQHTPNSSKAKPDIQGSDIREPMRTTLTFRRYMVLAAIMFTGSLGDIFLSAGMKQAGPVTFHHISSLFTALRIPWVIGGIVLLIVFLATYLTALSWADLTFVLPATSFSYVIIALLSKFWLQENISTGRWVGILLIMAGVGFVTRGPAYTYPPGTSYPESDARSEEPLKDRPR